MADKFESIGKLEPEYKDLYAAWQAQPDKHTTGELLKTVEPVLNNAIRSYATDMIGSPTLKSKARQLAIGAFKSYDTNRGSLRSHLLTNLQRLRRLAASERQIISMPEQVMRDQLQLQSAHNELQEQIGHPPSDSELADKTGLSLKRMHYIRQGARPVAEGTITQPGEEEGSGQYEPGTRAINVDYGPHLEFVYDDMPATNQYIMERAFGLHGHPRTVPTQIARQLKITPAAVSHRMAQIQGKIDELEELGGI